MPGFETPGVPVEKKKSELSPEDQAVMSRRNFLKAAGAAAVTAVAPEVMAAPERRQRRQERRYEQYVEEARRQEIVQTQEEGFYAPTRRRGQGTIQERVQTQAPEQERGQENVNFTNLKFPLPSERRAYIAQWLKRMAPGIKADFFSGGPGSPIAGYQICWVDVTIAFADGTQGSARAKGFYPPSAAVVEKMIFDAMEEAGIK